MISKNPFHSSSLSPRRATSRKTERVEDNAKDFNVSFDNEFKRVVIHGVLHLCGYKDKTEDEASLMRYKEEEKINMFHVEQ